MSQRHKKRLLITPECLKELHKHQQHKESYDAVFDQLRENDRTCARHAVRGTSDHFTVFESKITEDLRLCWSYGNHIGEPVILLWALGGHDSVFRRLTRLTGERFKVLRFEAAQGEGAGDVGEVSAIVVGDPKFAWRGVRPPSFLTFDRLKGRDQWVSEHLVLSEEQEMESLRDFKSAPLLLSGGGGSGKTTLLIRLLLKQLEAGERPILVTYHTKLAEYCRRLVGDHPLRAQALARIVTIDDLVQDWLTRLQLTEHARYLSQEEARALFIQKIPAELQEAAWAEFRGMWKGRVDVDAYAEKQRSLDALQGQHAQRSNLWLTAEGEEIDLGASPALTRKQQEQLERERDWRAHPKRRPKQKNDAMERQRVEFYERERERELALTLLSVDIERERVGLTRMKREYLISPQRYSKDVRFLEDQGLIKEAVSAYEQQLEGLGGDRLNACLELLTRAERIESTHTSLLIDEAQDFTQLELQLLSLCVPDPRAWVVAGDENQIVNPSGFRWERVKEVIWWSAQRLSGLLLGGDGDAKASLGALKDLEPIYLSVNFRNPQPVQRLARRVLRLKRLGEWAPAVGDEGSLGGEGPTQIRWSDDRSLTLEAPALTDERGGAPVTSQELDTAEDHPWTWQPQSVRVSDERELLKHIIMLSKSVPSFCLIVFSEKERRGLIARLKEQPEAKILEIDFERVLTPLEVKGLEFDLVLSLAPPLPTSQVEGIRDFEFNQLYVSVTRARTSLAYIWVDGAERGGERGESSGRAGRGGRAGRTEQSPEARFLAALTPPHEPLEDHGRADDAPIASVTWERHTRMSHLHRAQDRQDWSRSAQRYAAEGRPLLAAELYRLGGFYKESGELLEGLERYDEAIRDYTRAQLPLSVARCEGKRAERAGNLEVAHEAWGRYGEGSGEYEGVWRTMAGAVSDKALKWLAGLLSPHFVSRALNATSLSRQRPFERVLESQSFEERERALRSRPDLWALLRGDEVSKAQDSRDPHRRLAALRLSPKPKNIRSLARLQESALRLEGVTSLGSRPEGQKGGVPPGPALSLSDIEFLLGATTYYEAQSNQSKRRAALDQRPFQLPWSALPMSQDHLFDDKLKDYAPYHSIFFVNRILRSIKSEGDRQRTHNAVVRSYRSALHVWGQDVKVTQSDQDRGLLDVYHAFKEEGERQLSAKRLIIHEWRPQLERAYAKAGYGTLLEQPTHTHRAHSAWDVFGGEWRSAIQELIFIMSHLRLSHTPTRIRAAQVFAEVWLDLTLDLAGHWRSHKASDSLVFIEDEVLEQLSACSMSELRDFITRWERAAWERVTGEPLKPQSPPVKGDGSQDPPSIKGEPQEPKPYSQVTPEERKAIDERQAKVLSHLMGVWAMGQTLFLRGTWVSFINDQLKRAESLTGFGYQYLRAAHSHWVGLTLLPLHGMTYAMASYEEKVITKAERDELRAQKERREALGSKNRELTRQLRSLTRQRTDLRAELKRLMKATGEEERLLEQRRVDLEGQLRELSAKDLSLQETLSALEGQLAEVTVTLKGAEEALQRVEGPMLNLRAQRDFFEWAMRRADALQGPGRRLSDDEFKEVSATWRDGREWTKLIFDIGEGELKIFLPLLNRYRQQLQMRPFAPSDLHFRDGLRRSSKQRRGGESAWSQVMPGVKLSSPLKDFEERAPRQGELPSAAAQLAFAIEQGYTPLCFELFEDGYYLDRVSEQLTGLGGWAQAPREREALKAELNVLISTPRAESAPWLTTALELTHERPLSLFIHLDSEWSVRLLRSIRRRSPTLPPLLERGVLEVLCMWNHLSEAQQLSARACLYELERLWPCARAQAAVCLLMQHRPEVLEALYASGERWLLLAPLHARVMGERAGALRWLVG